MRANRGDWEGAAGAFRMWTKGGGKVLPGLVRRREAEIALFLS
jgi:lysozyme